MLRRRSEKLTFRSPVSGFAVTLSPYHLVTLSLCHPATAGQSLGCHSFRSDDMGGQEAQCFWKDAREAKRRRREGGMQDGGLGKLIDPEAAAVELRVRLGEAGEMAAQKMARGEFAGGEGVVNAFAGKGLDDARGIADEEEVLAFRVDRISFEGCDGAPRMIAVGCHICQRPTVSSRGDGWARHEAKIHQAAADIGEAAVAEGMKAHLHFRAEIVGQGEMRLRRHAVFPGGGQEAKEPGDRDASIGRHEKAGAEGGGFGGDFPARLDGGDGLAFAHVGAGFRARSSRMESKTLRRIAISPCGESARGQEIDSSRALVKITSVKRECGLRADSVSHAEPVEDRPARGIEAIPAHFLPGKHGAFQQQHAESRFRALRGAGRAGGAAADDGNVVFHSLRRRLPRRNPP